MHSFSNMYQQLDFFTEGGAAIRNCIEIMEVQYNHHRQRSLGEKMMSRNLQGSTLCYA